MEQGATRDRDPIEFGRGGGVERALARHSVARGKEMRWGRGVGERGRGVRSGAEVGRLGCWWAAARVWAGPVGLASA